MKKHVQYMISTSFFWKSVESVSHTHHLSILNAPQHPRKDTAMTMAEITTRAIGVLFAIELNF